MPIKVQPKELLLSYEERDSIAKCLKGEISLRAAGRQLETNYQNVYNKVFNIMRHAVMTNKIDIDDLIKDY